MRREEHEHEVSNGELLARLSHDYEQALLADDRMAIENKIAPRFWERFGPYFHAHAAE